MADSCTLVFSIAELERNTFSDAWSLGSITDALKKEYNILFVALEIQDKVVVGTIYGGENADRQLDEYSIEIENGKSKFLGYLIANYICDESELLRVAVDFRYRNMQIGTLLIDTYLNNKCDEEINYFLEVRDSNSAARHLYEKRGYCVIGTRRQYYNEPTEDAILYSKGSK